MSACGVLDIGGSSCRGTKRADFGRLQMLLVHGTHAARRAHERACSAGLYRSWPWGEALGLSLDGCTEREGESGRLCAPDHSEASRALGGLLSAVHAGGAPLTFSGVHAGGPLRGTRS